MNSRRELIPTDDNTSSGPIGSGGLYTNLDYLRKQSKGNPVLMKKMIEIYLRQTPELLNLIKQGIEEKDWASVYTSVHKMIPSFWMMGIDSRIEKIAKIIQEHASNKEYTEEIPNLFSQLEDGSLQACKELKQSLTEFD